MQTAKRLYKFVTLFPKIQIVFIGIMAFSLLVFSSFSSKPAIEEPERLLSKKITATKFLDLGFKESSNIQELKIKVRRNDSLISILKKSSINENSIKQIIESKNSELLTQLKIGEELIINTNDKGELLSMKYIKKPTQGIEVNNIDGSFSIKPYIRSTESVPIYKKVVIEESLYRDGLKSGIPDSVIMDMAYIYGWDIDFTYDLRPGDSYSLIYEEVLLDGEKIKDGDILIAKFNVQGKEIIATRYDQKNGKAEYFSPKGQNMKKAFLRSPVEFSYVSSKYNLKRKHPILYKIKAHTGVDYAAARGTPVIATGDGSIIYASRNSGYGNLVEIKHSEDYSTKYAHLERFHKRSYIGSKIKQGDIIGYVGKSGMATGYHLHYEFHVNGRHTNPLTVKFPNAQPVNSRELNIFNKLFIKRLNKIDTFERLTTNNAVL